MNRKNLPALFMLTAGGIMCIVTYVMDFSVLGKLVSLFLVMLVFGILGGILQWTLEYFDRQNEEALKSAEAEGGEEETATTEDVQI